MTSAGRGVAVDSIGPAPREMVLRPDPAARRRLADRLGLPDLPALTCTFSLRLDRGGRVLATCTLDGRIVQTDVTTLDEFETDLHAQAALRFVPELELRNELDPDDPVDEVGYLGATLDLEEAMAQQLALSLDPYPRAA